jgi:hypothetical protein
MEHKDLIQEITNAQKNPLYLPLQQPILGSKIAITKSMYILLGGQPGSGKTAIVDSVFVLDLYDWWIKNKDKTLAQPYWIYRSMERNVVLKRAKWLAYRMFKDHQVIIDVPTIFNWPNKMYNLSSKMIELMKTYDDYFDQMFEHIDIISGAENPTGVNKHIWAYYTKPENGELKYKEIDTLDDTGKPTKRNIIGGYKSKKPNTIVFHITDHIGKLKTEKIHGSNIVMNDKQVLDKHSEYMGGARDLFGMVPIDISQLNRNIEDTFRNVKTEIDVMPQDFKGSADIFENADIVIGMINPYKLSAFDYAGYDIKKFVSDQGFNMYRALKVLKNSYGVDDFRISYFFGGSSGTMIELPSVKSFEANPNLYDIWTNPPNKYKEYI